MKRLMALLLLVPLLFAASDWRTVGTLAIVTAAILLAVLYMIGYGFNLNELKFLTEEEFYQLIATVFIMGLLVGAEAYIGNLANGAFGKGLPEEGVALLNERLAGNADMFRKLQDFAVSVGESASKSSFCSLSGIGVSLSTCGAYQALAAPASFAYQMLGLAVAELGSLLALVRFGSAYAFTMILPAGLLLRTFRITRGAGGVLMALAISLYVAVPTAVIAMKDISAQALLGKDADGNAMIPGVVPGSADPGNPAVSVSIPPPDGCDAFKVYSANYETAKEGLGRLAGGSRGIVYEFLINTTMTTIVALTAMIVSTQSLARLLGSEIDLSALARVA